MASSIVQRQIASLACGSVVDALYVEDLEAVIIPPRELVDAEAASEAWDDLSASVKKQAEAINLVESALRELGL